MSDFIDRQKLVKMFEQDGDNFRSQDIRHIINMIPSDPVRKPRRWILHDVSCEQSYECPYCNKWFKIEQNEDFEKWKFCPMCGSDVRH